MTTTIDTLESGTIITAENRAAWLEARRHGIGASEAAAALGLCPFATPLELWLRKRGLTPPVEETRRMRIGTLQEPTIAALYQDDTGHRLGRRQVFVRHPDRPWMTATLDALRDVDARPVEFKTADWRKAEEWGEPGSGEVPVHYAVNAQHQMFVAAADLIDIAVLLGGNDFRIYTLERDERIISRLIEAEADFMRRLAEDDPPPPTAGADAGLYRHLYPEPEGEVELAGDPAGDVAVYEALGREIGEKQRLRDMAKARLLAALGPAQVGRLADGRAVRRSVIEVKEHVVKGSTQTRLTISKAKG